MTVQLMYGNGQNKKPQYFSNNAEICYDFQHNKFQHCYWKYSRGFLFLPFTFVPQIKEKVYN